MSADTVSLVGLVLTIVALGIAAWQTFQATTQAREIETIHKSLTTRYLDPFPSFMPQVIDLINSATSDLTILIDVPGYAMFSKHDIFVQFKNSIEERLAKGVRVTLVFLNQQRRAESFREIFHVEPTAWKQWIERDTTQSKLLQFYKYEGDGVVPKDVSPDVLIEALEKAYERVLQSAFRTARQVQVNQQLSMHFWIADGRSAIFTIPTFAPDDITQGFATSDSRLIAALQKIAQRYDNNRNIRGQTTDNLMPPP